MTATQLAIVELSATQAKIFQFSQFSGSPEVAAKLKIVNDVLDELSRDLATDLEMDSNIVENKWKK